MLVLLAGLVLFLGVHSVSIAALSWRNETAARLGHMRWQALYSVVAAIGIVLIVVGYGIARRSPVVLYTPPVALRHVALLLMLPVFPLFFATYLPGRIRSAAKHPTLVATKLWAVAHLLANGTLADVLLFGGFLVWAVVDRISVKRRPAAQTRRIPAAPPRAANDAIALVGGLAVYALLLFGGHRWLTGMPLLAG